MAVILSKLYNGCHFVKAEKSCFNCVGVMKRFRTIFKNQINARGLWIVFQTNGLADQASYEGYKLDKLWKLCIWCLHWNANPYFLFKASMYFIITAYKSLLFSQIHFHIEVFCWRFFRACQFCWYTFPNKNLILLSLLLRSRLSGVLNRLILNWPYGKLQSFIFSVIF